MDFTAKLNELKTKAEAAKTEKTRAEATLENLNRQKAEVEAELAKLGVTPEQLPAEIEKLGAEISEHLAQAEQLLNPTPPETPQANPPEVVQ